MSHPKKIFDKDILLKIQGYSQELGFELFGITKPLLQKEDYDYLKSFIEEKKCANMHWFSNYPEIRLNPQKILPNSKSVIVLGFYYRDIQYEDIIKNQKIKISRYAIGKDYHNVLKKKLKQLEKFIKIYYKDIYIRSTIDSAPVPEKLLAKYAGLGWQGKNTNIINPEIGSYFFLSCIFTDYEIPSDWESKQITDHCKGCRLCIEHCPTKALEPYKLIVERCISYLTIESKIPIPEEYLEKSNGWVFGCDICQEVCPFNRRKNVSKKTTKEFSFLLREEIKNIIHQLPEKEEWENLKNSPLKRVKYEIFKENYKNILKYEYTQC